VSIKCLPGLVVLALLAAAGPACAGFNSPTLLFDTPTADVLPAASIAISADMTYPLTKTTQNVDYMEFDANVRFSPLRHLDLAVTAYTFADYVLDAKYQILGGDPGRIGLAIGVLDIGLNEYVSPIGNGLDAAWPDWRYDAYLPRYNRTTERFSAYAVTSVPVTRFARLNLGLGRGRFVGYDSRSKYLNSDIFFEEYHQWAVALFGGVEVYVNPHVALVAEASSRDMNTGVKASFGPVAAAVAWTKMEGLVFAKGDDQFGRLELGVSYQIDFRRRAPAALEPAEPFRPEPTPEPEPEPVAVEPVKFDLVPIHFDLDKSDIRPGDAEILKRNADAILAKAGAGQQADVIVEGHCCPYASEAYNVGLGARRAESARKYLVGLGVDAALLSTISLGEANPPYTNEAEYYLNRRCEFKWKY